MKVTRKGNIHLLKKQAVRKFCSRSNFLINQGHYFENRITIDTKKLYKSKLTNCRDFMIFVLKKK